MSTDLLLTLNFTVTNILIVVIGILIYNKIVSQHETPKVGTNKQAKEGYTSCTHFLNTSDKCWSCGEDYKNHQPG